MRTAHAVQLGGVLVNAVTCIPPEHATLVFRAAPRVKSVPTRALNNQSQMASTSSLNPRTTSYDFLGPPGALAISLGVPFLIYGLYFGCNETSGGCIPPVELTLANLQYAFTHTSWWTKLWDTEATLLYLAWYAFTVVSWFMLPGDWVEGVTMRTGEKKRYKINGATHILATIYLRADKTNLYSFLYYAACIGSNWGLHLCFWSRIVHVLIREVDRFRHGICVNVSSTSSLCVLGILLGREVACIGWE